jgi:hypothetical protein
VNRCHLIPTDSQDIRHTGVILVRRLVFQHSTIPAWGLPCLHTHLNALAATRLCLELPAFGVCHKRTTILPQGNLTLEKIHRVSYLWLARSDSASHTLETMPPQTDADEGALAGDFP